MAKQTVPGVQSGGSALPKIVFWITVIAFLVLVIKSPADAASLVTNVMSGVGQVAEALMTFSEGVS